MKDEQIFTKPTKSTVSILKFTQPAKEDTIDAQWGKMRNLATNGKI